MIVGRFLNRIGLSNWRRRVIAALIVFPVFGVASVEITSQSWFCNSCHIMEPYYSSWKSGAHKDVECVKCHIDPGMTNFLAAKFNGLGQVVDDVLHRTSMKPSTSVGALACTRSGCHDMEKVRRTAKESGAFLFKHDKHLDLEYDGIKLGCSTCHSHVKGTQHFEVNTNVCVTCHMLERTPQTATTARGTATPTLIRLAVRGDRPASPAHASGSGGASAPAAAAAGASSPAPTSCQTCHTPPKETLDVGGVKFNHTEYLAYGATCESCHHGATAVPTPIDSGQCYRCHDFGIERLTSSEEMHRSHMAGDHKVECFECHGTVLHGPNAQTARIEQFDCQKCHIDQHSVQRRTYLQNGAAFTADATSPMFMAHVDCTGCHVSPRPVRSKPDSGALVIAASPKGCDGCHREGLGDQMIPLWQKTTRTLYDGIEADLKTAEAGPDAQGRAADFAKVRALLTQVRVDGSWGVHNPRFVQQLLQEARQTLSGTAPAAPGGPS